MKKKRPAPVEAPTADETKLLIDALQIEDAALTLSFRELKEAELKLRIATAKRDTLREIMADVNASRLVAY